MIKNYKFRLYPSKSILTKLNNSLEICRNLYNKLLNNQKDNYEKHKNNSNKLTHFLPFYTVKKTLPSLKESTPDLANVHSQVLQDVVKRQDLAFKAFFRRLNKAKETRDDPGFPRFKGKGRYDSITFPQFGNGISFDGTTLQISKIGNIKIKKHREIQGTPKSAIIKKECGRWFVSISCKIEDTPKVRITKKSKVLGIDVGVRKIATFSDENIEPIENPKILKNNSKKLAKAYQKLSSQKKGSPERAKARKIVSNCHYRIKNRRMDFLHKTSKNIVNFPYNIFAIEKLNVKNMLKNVVDKSGSPDYGQHSKHRNMSDAGNSSLLGLIAYKAEEAGKHVVRVNPANTSRTCHKCGSIKKDLGNNKVFLCDKCQTKMDRDYNAAINIKTLGLQCLNQLIIGSRSSRLQPGE